MNIAFLFDWLRGKKRRPLLFKLVMRDVFEYVEGDRRTLVAVEREKQAITILQRSICEWEGPHGVEPIKTADQERIARLLESELKSRGHPCYILT